MDERIALPLVTAVIGLVGVALGGYVSWSNQKAERQRAFLRSQLDGFYAPLLGLRERIRAKSESRKRVGDAADAAWRKENDGAGIERQRDLEKGFEQSYGQIIKYDNEQLFNELLPLYRAMIDHFSKNIGLAEPSTREWFREFVHYVDIWDRSEKKALPAAVSRELNQREEKVFGFYADLEENVLRLQEKLKKG